MDRTANQKAADEFDLALFRLIGTAKSQKEKMRQGARQYWNEVEMLLRQARPQVRHMMHPEDRNRTTEAS